MEETGKEILEETEKEIKEDVSNRNRIINIYLLYTMSFFVVAFITFLPFVLNGKTFIWETDGISQHYPALVYYGELLKDMLSGKGFPMVDFQIGMGFDTITTLHYYVIGDPIALLSILITPENSTIVYALLIILRIYLVGISFIIFARYWKMEGLGVLLGALIYTFCGFIFFAGVRHPFFVNPMIYLPLILIGLEEALDRKKPYLLIGMAFICTVSNFYFLYILTVIAVFYVIYRYITTYRKMYKNFFVGFLLTGLKTGAYYLLGIGLASFILLPVIYAFMQNGRLNQSPVPSTGYLFYNKNYYILLLKSIFASGKSPGYWVLLSYSSVTAVSFVIILCNRKFWQLRGAGILTAIALIIPAFGYFMNGFSYIANRWSFSISLLVAISLTMTFQYLFKLKKMEKIILVIGAIGYFAISLVFPSSKVVKAETYLLLITMTLILVLQAEWFKKRKVLQNICLYLMVMATLGFHGYVCYSPGWKGYINEFLGKEKVVNITNKSVMSVINEIEDDSFYRIETYGDVACNEALYVDFNDVSGYYSLMDGNYTSYFQQMELLGQINASRFDNMDNRVILDALASVKYMVASNKLAAPYGYKLIKEKVVDSKTYYLYENTYALPLGYTYQSYLLEEDYNNLNALQKQNAMMYAVILEEGINHVDVSKQDMSIGIQKLDLKLVPDENVNLFDNLIMVNKTGAKIALVFSSMPGSETYVRFEDLKINKNTSAMTTLKVSGEKEGPAKKVNIRNLYHVTYFGKDDYLVNAGYSTIEKTKLKITFPKKESYRYQSIDLFSLDMKHYKTQVEALSDSSLQNIVVENNRIQGNVTLQEKGVMVLSIPYSKGWRAYVDGKETEIIRGNVMYSALLLDAGEHHILLKYETPFLKEGFLLSMISALIYLGIIIFNKINNKKNNL